MSTKEGDSIGRVGALGGRSNCMLLLSAFLDFIAASNLSFGPWASEGWLYSLIGSAERVWDALIGRVPTCYPFMFFDWLETT
ncbi:hypothetical protein ASPVEDRAFT_80130 [Aspergillus versicolor CBS 583.65]|uniref:Uncharacterized protein n=1 Tax=Aspergillus versicolor CBS 583.65 TaxID=1036611 RepID=A0A1L9PAL0_ASPVE|nr:uncharacterized protein ASPVEDRAFT_80130 [Aspergillus versicolor CBS 583.65]OJI98484.1 hypothetical protein ASPVEDRAFT_80130 [Aspergillus versicolor CBS 583.65]